MVHQFKFKELNIVLDICSGSLHVVDDIAYDIIEMYKSHTPEQIVSQSLKIAVLFSPLIPLSLWQIN